MGALMKVFFTLLLLISALSPSRAFSSEVQLGGFLTCFIESDSGTQNAVPVQMDFLFDIKAPPKGEDEFPGVLLFTMDAGIKKGGRDLLMKVGYSAKATVSGTGEMEIAVSPEIDDIWGTATLIVSPIDATSRSELVKGVLKDKKWGTHSYLCGAYGIDG